MGDGESGKVSGGCNPDALNERLHDIVRHSHDTLILVIDA